MNKDFQNFFQNKTFENAMKCLRHKDKISAQCVYFDELKLAEDIVKGAM